MNFRAAQAIADAILFEGYILYPYRPSAIKNRQRWNFGTLYPRGFARSQAGECSAFSAQVLFSAGPNASISAWVRFLKLSGASPIAGSQWQTGTARSYTESGVALPDLERTIERIVEFGPDTGEETGDPHGPSAGTLQGRLTLRAQSLGGQLFRLHLIFENTTPICEERGASCESTSRRSTLEDAFVSAHTILQIDGGEFISLLEPQEQFENEVKECAQDGVFPVLVGEPGDRHCVLCSPIILYDYPQVAPESTGDFFDGTEMDEMLALRVLTLTEEEKREMRSGDDHARAILDRMETLPPEHLAKLHGAVRGLRPVPDPSAEIDLISAPFDPFAEHPSPTSVQVFGMEVKVNDRVRIWPQNRADILDMALEGKVAVIEAIEQDLEDNIQFAVVLEDDPGRDLGMLRQPGHRFFFTPHEVEPLAPETK